MLMNLYEVGGNPEASPLPSKTIWLVITKISRSHTFSNTKPLDNPRMEKVLYTIIMDGINKSSKLVK